MLPDLIFKVLLSISIVGIIVLIAGGGFPGPNNDDDLDI